MPNEPVMSIWKRLLYSLGSMMVILVILVLAILLFVSFGSGPGWPRGIAGLILTAVSFVLVWLSLAKADDARASWLGILAGMSAWMVIGEISHQFGFVKIENEAGIVLLIFITVIAMMIRSKVQLPWGFKVFTTTFLLNWWGHAILLPQLFLAETFNAPVFEWTYKITGFFCLHACLAILIRIIRRPATKAQLVVKGLWLYTLLVTGIEGVTNITANTFGN